VKKLFICGGGDFGREVLWACSEIPREARDWEPYAFLDDDVQAATARMGKYGISLPVAGSIRDHQPASDEVFVCCIADPRQKLQICETLKQKNAAFINVIHPTVAIAPGATVGEGCILCRGVILSSDAQIGNFVIVNFYSTAGHNCVVEDGCTINCHCDITGWVKVGRGAYLGTHSAVLPGARIGEFATVGAGSVVLRKVEAGKTAIGVPARHI
jgi:sugar O-acyltransferase (sialic acid O-acetyltransferase NeuD family)